MKKVLKSAEPKELQQYRQRFSFQVKRWSDLKSNRATFNAIRITLAADQKGLCAYCEMSLHDKNRSVDHFIPRNQSTPEKNHDLDWQNMLAICLPPGGVKDDDLQNSQQLPHNSPCCGKKKDDFIPDGRLLNPLELPKLRLFKFSSKDGEIRPDEMACIEANISV
ncbi:hypothetical protein [Cylindrospermum sp. FACHB-282]|uniref:hypothetical protein n=1 Tax=Cylindrospermum sp. FACHB-282 TaxID=2692794 RepID=UPI0018F03F9F|nr:hypothetical protein [Cylindrospermum sp. FACHB-282]